MSASRTAGDDPLRALVQQVERAYAAGNLAEGDSLLERARSLAPEHALVLNATGVQCLNRGDLERARAALEQAVAKDGSNPSFWINLATVRRRQGQLDAEMQALQRALAIEPRHLLALLQKAALLQLMGKPRASATVYLHALQTLPRGGQVPSFLRPAIEKATAAVAQNNAALEKHLRPRLRAAAAEQEDSERFEHCIAALLGKRKIYHPEPTFLHFPSLPSYEFFPRGEFAWLGAVEAATPEIRSEFQQVYAQGEDALEAYVNYPEGVPLDQWEELNASKRWGVFYLWREGVPIERNIERCPRTASVLRGVPYVDVAQHGPTAFFSILAPHTRIPAHTGVTNTRLIVHLPLVVPSGCGFRVGSQTRAWREGQAWVFDDTIEHEAWNDSDLPRAVLIFDIWNPHLTPAERTLIRAAVEGIRDYYQDQSPLTGGL